MTDTLSIRKGAMPLVVSFPHSGTDLCDGLDERLTAAACTLPDTDWHVPALYAFLRDLDVTTVTARQSRYVVDLNRDPVDVPLYPGQFGTGFCPLQTFDGTPVYKPGAEPDATEISHRRDKYWQPYHDALAVELSRLQEKHETVFLWDAHSIRSTIPTFFEGKLPDFNFGTNGGLSADPDLAKMLLAVLKEESGFTSVLNGRFQGGHITRTYGQPSKGVHAIQLELAQSSYMNEREPAAGLNERARHTGRIIEELIGVVLAFNPGTE